MIVIGKVVGVKITSPTAEYRQGVKGRRAGSYYRGGTVHVRNGFGGQWDITPKRIILTVMLEDRCLEVRIDSDFRYKIGRLTPKRTRAICAAVPETVTLYENETWRGETFYTLTEASFSKWLCNLNL